MSWICFTNSSWNLQFYQWHIPHLIFFFFPKLLFWLQGLSSSSSSSSSSVVIAWIWNFCFVFSLAKLHAIFGFSFMATLVRCNNLMLSRIWLIGGKLQNCAILVRCSFHRWRLIFCGCWKVFSPLDIAPNGRWSLHLSDHLGPFGDHIEGTADPKFKISC